MATQSPPNPATTAETLAKVLATYEDGRFVDAWEAGRDLGPLATWAGTDARVVAGRLAYRLGAPRLGARLFIHAHRHDPAHPDAQYYYVSRVADRRGAFAGWRERVRLGAPDATTTRPHARADYYGQCAQLLGTLRDYPAAEAMLARSRDAAPERPYYHVERAYLFHLEDRFDDAHAATQQGLAATPRYAPLLAVSAQYLQLLGRHDEALELLERVAPLTQSADVAALLARALMRANRFDDADRALTRYDDVTPLKERDAASWIAATRGQIALARGEYRRAAQYFAESPEGFFKGVAESLTARLDDPTQPPPHRVELAVPFVRQHHRTCVPATLTAISRFWKAPAEHLEVAEAICYDGTPAHSERRWAADHGWLAREFRVEWATAQQLIDRGVPFTLTMGDAVSGHLVAVNGYDEALGALLARDPMTPETVEIKAAALLAYQRAAGPRGMVIVPAAQAALLDGIALPEAELYDRYHAMQLALERHDRAAAITATAALAQLDAGHRLTLTARRALASYDANPHELRAALDALVALYPEDQALQLAVFQSLRDTASREERLTWLAHAAAKPGTDASLLVEYAIELAADDRLAAAAERQLSRARRRRHDYPFALHQLATLKWRRGGHAEAAELFRFAACLEDLREPYAQSYFTACRWLREPETAIAFLRSRFERLGTRSGLPAVTLFNALASLDRTEEAFAVLRDAVAARPDDGDLRLFAAARCAQYGFAADAMRHRAAAAGRVAHADWLADTARQARRDGDRAQALRNWREVVAISPLDLEAHDAIALLLTETTSRGEAVAHLRAVCAAFPHHAGIHHLLYQWSAGNPAAEREHVLRAIAAIDPANAWAQREIALNLVSQSRLPEAVVTARAAVALDAASPVGHTVCGHVLRLAGRNPEAAAAFRAALERSADAGDAINGLLLAHGDTVAHAKESLTFVLDRLLSQAVFGDGFLTFRFAARGVLMPAELLDALRQGQRRRPELWHAWSALSRHLAEMGLTDEALALAREATERFPMVPALWLDLSQIYRARLDVDARIAALGRCRDIDGDAVDPILELCDAYEQAGRIADARALLDAALRRNPLASALRARMAKLLHDTGDVDAAIAVLRATLEHDPDYAWAWQRLAEWSQTRGRATGALDLARTLAESHNEAAAWTRLADLELGTGRPELALHSASRALEFNPCNEAARDLQVGALALLGRFREAEEACRAAIAETGALVLQGRAAWIDAQRGDVSGALEKMRAVLANYPDYVWGWEQVADWSARADDLPGAIAAARRLEWLTPGSVVPLGWLGDFLKRAGNRAEAKAAFQRAMRLAPAYLFAGLEFLGIQLVERDFDGARRTLEILRPHAPPERMLAAAIALAAAERAEERAFTLAAELCARPEGDPNAIWAASDAINHAGWGRRLERLVRGLLRGTSWHPALPAVWATLRTGRGRYGSVLHYRWLAGLGPPAHEAVSVMLGAMGAEAKRVGPSALLIQLRLAWHLFWIRRFCRDWRATDNQYWGQMGYALLCRERPRALLRWMRDWRSRGDLDSWMYQNIAVAYLALRRDAEALAMLAHIGHDVVPVKPVKSSVKLWCILAACIDGDPALAADILHRTPLDSVLEAERALREFAGTVVMVLQEPRGTPLRPPHLRIIDAMDLKSQVAGRLVKLAKLKVARHCRSRWDVFKAWADIHKPQVTTLGIILVIGILRLLAAMGS